jgi:hypothetical protein
MKVRNAVLLVLGILVLTMVPVTKAPVFAESPDGVQRLLAAVASQLTLPSIDAAQSPLADLLTPYRAQGASDSGACASANCGPAVVAMAIGWARNGQWIPISDIRSYMSGTNCRYTDVTDLRNALTNWSVSYATITGLDAVRDAINNRGHIVIVPVAMSSIPAGSDYLTAKSDPANHYDRFYSFTGGHFVD